jgi:tetratricopeptide (TPR) repeat protein
LEEPLRSKTAADIHAAKSSLYLLISDFRHAHDEMQCVLKLSRLSGERAREGGAWAGMGFASSYAHEFEQAYEESAHAIAIADELNDTTIRCAALLARGYVHLILGRLPESKVDFSHVQRIGRSKGDAFRESFALITLGHIERLQGNYKRSIHLLSDAQALARSRNVPLSLMRSIWISGLAAAEQGAYDEALAAFEESIALTQKIGDESYYLRTLNSLGWLYLSAGNIRRSMEFNQRAAEESRTRGDAELMANSALNLADVHMAAGDLSAAWEALRGVCALADDPHTSAWMKWRYSQHLFASLGELWLARGNPSKAEENIRHCARLAKRHNSRKYIARALRLQGQVQMARMDLEGAEHSLAQALAVSQRIRQPTETWKAYEALAQLYLEQSRPQAAEQSSWAALNTLEELRSHTKSSELGGSIDASLYHSRLQALRKSAQHT